MLVGRADVEDVVQPMGTTTLDLLPAGQLPPNPSELLGSPAMAGLLDRLTTSYDTVLADSSPVLPVTDAAVLSKQAGGALTTLSENVVRRASRDGRSVLVVPVRPGLTRLEALDNFASRIPDRTYLLVQ